MRVRWKDFELPTRVSCDEKTATPTYAMFSAEPFERGFANTIGNSLRRVLYSSIEGTAVTGVKVKGVAHEFSTIEGIVEDVTDIVLNLKQLVVKIAEPGQKIVKEALLNKKDQEIPSWLKLAEEQATGTVVTLPTAQELQVPVESQLIVEYMSR